MTVSQWSTTPASNVTIADATYGDVHWEENQSPSSVNDSARSMMAHVKAWHDARKGCRVSTATAQNIAYNSATAVQFATATETFDALGFFTEGTSNTNFVVPAGVTYIRVWAQLTTATTGAATAPIIVGVIKNASAIAYSTTLSASGFACYPVISTGAFVVTTGDVITIQITQLTDNPGPLSLASAQINIEVVQ